MADPNDRRRILDMLAQGKITAAEADDLLTALGSTPSDAGAADPAGAQSLPRYMRIVVHRHAREARDTAGFGWPGMARPEKTVSVRIPIALVKSGMRLGAIVPGTAGDIVTNVLRERGINLDLSKLNPDELAGTLKDLGEMSVDVDNGRAQVRITCE